jgi:hypothetical protein
MASSGGAAPLPSNPNDNDGPRILGATLAITSLALITYVARMYVRLFVVHNVGLDVRRLPILTSSRLTRRCSG